MSRRGRNIFEQLLLPKNRVKCFTISFNSQKKKKNHYAVDDFIIFILHLSKQKIKTVTCQASCKSMM